MAFASSSSALQQGAIERNLVSSHDSAQPSARRVSVASNESRTSVRSTGNRKSLVSESTLSAQQWAALPMNSPRKMNQVASTKSGDSDGSTASGSSHPPLAPLGDMRFNATWTDTPSVPNLRVRIHGRREELHHVPLVVAFRRGEKGDQLLVDQASQAPFEEYLSEEIGERVTGVYYRVRRPGCGRTKGGAKATELTRFDGKSNPFVGGMEIVVSVNGDPSVVESTPTEAGCCVQ